jgi:D-aminopeptidase
MSCASSGCRVAALCGVLVLGLSTSSQGAEGRETKPAQGPLRPRARDLGITIGLFRPGPDNAVTDVSGVLVGHFTLRSGQDVRTGVTAVLPHGGNLFQEKVPAAIVVGNGFGKLVGSTQVEELGTLETPIVLTNTLSVFTAADAVVDYVLAQPGNEEVRSVNPVVGETNDGYLNDIRGRHVQGEHVLAAIRAARGGPIDEGSVGAGTGTRCLGFKGGIGTASRRMPEAAGGYTVGVLVQSNFGGLLTVAGAPVGKELGRYDLKDLVESPPADDGSCMIVVATDAPLDARGLKRLARRALLGLGAVGSAMAHGSGDYVIAFSTHEAVRVRHASGRRERDETVLDDQALSPLFQATREATEEAILNSLLRATSVTGFRGRTVEAIPIDRVVEICRRYGVTGGPPD